MAHGSNGLKVKQNKKVGKRQMIEEWKINCVHVIMWEQKNITSVMVSKWTTDSNTTEK